RDAEISARHVHEVWRIATEELDRIAPGPPITLGSMAADYVLRGWDKRGIVETVLGWKELKVKRWNESSGRYVHKKIKKFSPNYRINEEIARLCYHGGRNECFAYGPTVDGDKPFDSPFVEHDLIG